jgi:hypothetical protein
LKPIITRVSYNTNHWLTPSGPDGKSRNPIHEQIYGFGFEEWLFNNLLVREDGYHYGYIEGIHKNYTNGDEKHPLHLFTINERNRNRNIVAEIGTWKKVDFQESANIVNQFPIVINQMNNDLNLLENPNAVGKFIQHQNNQNGFQLFNIKFQDFLYCYDFNNPLPRNNRIYSLNRFWLYR